MTAMLVDLLVSVLLHPRTRMGLTAMLVYFSRRRCSSIRAALSIPMDPLLLVAHHSGPTTLGSDHPRASHALDSSIRTPMP
jgi:hypothetical protein